MYTSDEPGYQSLITSGPFGGVYDRFDQILVSEALPDEVRAETYTAFGNDGAHFNDSINAVVDLAVSAEIARSLHGASDHLPVYVDFVFGMVSGIEDVNVPDELDLSIEEEGAGGEVVICMPGGDLAIWGVNAEGVTSVVCWAWGPPSVHHSCRSKKPVGVKRQLSGVPGGGHPALQQEANSTVESETGWTIEIREEDGGVSVELLERWLEDSPEFEAARKLSRDIEVPRSARLSRPQQASDEGPAGGSGNAGGRHCRR